MKNSISILLISIALFSCKSGTDKPDNLIEEKEMVMILTDMTLLEATYNTRLIRVSDKKELMIKYSEEILRKHQVSKERFDLSYEYYIDEPEKFEAILELIFEELNKLETEASKYNEMDIENDSTKVVD
jgi:hypothetical protein